MAYCGKNFGKSKKSINKNSTVSANVTKIGGKKIDLRKNFKVYVAAYQMINGKKQVLAKTIIGHVVGRKNTKYTNAKKIKLSKSVYTLETGKTAKISAKTVLVSSRKKQLTNAHEPEFRYASTDESVATVNGSGIIKGVGTGICTVYVYSRNGYAKKVSVTVK